MSFFTRQRWVLLLAAVMAVAAPGISYAQFDLKGRAVETLTNGVMKELEKKFSEMVAKEAISAAAKTNVVKNLSEISRPMVKNFIDGAALGKLPKQAELVNSVLKDIMPRVPEFVAAAVTEDGGVLDVKAASTVVAGSTAQVAVSYDDEKDFTVEIINESNTVRITKYAGKNTEIRIPPRIDDRPVTEIGERVFVKKGLTSVAIPESVIFIGNMAFADNQIGSVSIGANVYIANNAFENTGYNSFSAGFYNSQGRRAGTYSNSWRLVSAASAAQPARPSSNNTVSVSTSSAAASAASPDSAVVFAGNGHKYEVINTKMSWAKARDDCKKRGGHLATITSNEEQEFIVDLLSKTGKKDMLYWLGGRYTKGLQWITGEDVYDKKMGGFPYGAGGADSLYANMYGGFDWHAGNNLYGYICEWDAD